MKQELRHVLGELRVKLHDVYGSQLVNLILYGSQARGDATDDSDIDVLVVLRGAFSRAEEMRRTSELVAALSLKYDTLVSRQFISEADCHGFRTPLLLNVQREGISI